MNKLDTDKVKKNGIRNIWCDTDGTFILEATGVCGTDVTVHLDADLAGSIKEYIDMMNAINKAAKAA